MGVAEPVASKPVAVIVRQGKVLDFIDGQDRLGERLGLLGQFDLSSGTERNVILLGQP